MAIAVIITFDVDNDKFDDFINFLKGSLPDTRGFEGCIGLEVAANKETSTVILSELWRTKDHQLAYRAWRAERGDSAVYASFQAEAPEFVDYDLIEIPR